MSEQGRRALIIGFGLVAACGDRTELGLGSLSSSVAGGSAHVAGGTGFGGAFGVNA